MAHGSTRERGASLLEMIVYIAVLAILVSLALQVFISGSRVSALGTATLDRMLVLADLDEDFVDTVRSARRIVSEVARYKTGPDMLVLELPAETGRRYAVFGQLGETPQMNRLILVESQGTLEVERFATYRTDLSAISFEFDAALPLDARCVTLSLAPKVPDRAQVKPVVTIMASIRNGSQEAGR